MVVGDIDVDAIEAQIKKMFSDIPAQPNAAKREYYPVNDNKEPIVLVYQDKDSPMYKPSSSTSTKPLLTSRKATWAIWYRIMQPRSSTIC